MQNNQTRTLDRPILKTDRLKLRRPDTGDIASIVAIAGDWEVSRRLGRVPHPYGEKDAVFFLGTVVPKEWTWAITWLETGELIGMVGLSPAPGDQTAELGYYLSPRFWGIGVATEAGKAVVHHGFVAIGFQSLISHYFSDNPASGRVLRKLGFIETGPVTRPCLAVGSMQPSVEMHLDRGRSG